MTAQHVGIEHSLTRRADRKLEGSAKLTKRPAGSSRGLAESLGEPYRCSSA